jgi:hypothetical protein
MNSSGPISLGGASTGQSINLEIGQPATSTVSLNDTNVRTLANKPTINTTITVPTDFYGKSLADAWFMTLSSPVLSYSFPNFAMDFDNSGNMIFWWSQTQAWSASIGPTGTVNWINSNVSLTNPNSNSTGIGIERDTANPSTLVVWGYSGGATTPTYGTRRAWIAKLNASTGALTDVTTNNWGPSTPASLGNLSGFTSYFPFANGNFIGSTGGTRPGPPTNNSARSDQLLNPSYTQILPLALPNNNNPPGLNYAWTRFSYTDPSKTGATIMGSVPNGGLVVSQTQTWAQSYAWAKLDQNGNVTYVKRMPYQSPNQGSVDWCATQINKRNYSHNFITLTHALKNVYSQQAIFNYTNNFVTRINKTTGVVEETKTQYASNTAIDVNNGPGEIWNMPGSEIDDNNNIAKGINVGYGTFPTTGTNTFNLRYFNLNNPITNTYSAQFNSSTAPFTFGNFQLQQTSSWPTYQGYNYIIFSRNAVFPASFPPTICILKLKSDGTSIASGLNVTAPTGLNVQLTPIANLPLFTQSAIPTNDETFINSTATFVANPPTSITSTAQSITVTKNNI